MFTKKPSYMTEQEFNALIMALAQVAVGKVEYTNWIDRCMSVTVTNNGQLPTGPDYQLVIAYFNLNDDTHSESGSFQISEGKWQEAIKAALATI